MKVYDEMPHGNNNVKAKPNERDGVGGGQLLNLNGVRMIECWQPKIIYG